MIKQTSLVCYLGHQSIHTWSERNARRLGHTDNEWSKSNFPAVKAEQLFYSYIILFFSNKYWVFVYFRVGYDLVRVWDRIVQKLDLLHCLLPIMVMSRVNNNAFTALIWFWWPCDRTWEVNCSTGILLSLSDLCFVGLAAFCFLRFLVSILLLSSTLSTFEVTNSLKFCAPWIKLEWKLDSRIRTWKSRMKS